MSPASPIVSPRAEVADDLALLRRRLGRVGDAVYHVRDDVRIALRGITKLVEHLVAGAQGQFGRRRYRRVSDELR